MSTKRTWGFSWKEGSETYPTATAMIAAVEQDEAWHQEFNHRWWLDRRWIGSWWVYFALTAVWFVGTFSPYPWGAITSLLWWGYIVGLVVFTGVLFIAIR